MYFRIKSKTDFDDSIERISKKHGNNPNLVKALIKVESNFRPDAHRKTAKEDSRGLGQINASTARLFGVVNLENLFEPDFNIEIMNKVIDDHQTRYKNVWDLISAYNAGRPIYRKDGKYINSIYVTKVYSNFLFYNFLNIV